IFDWDFVPQLLPLEEPSQFHGIAKKCKVLIDLFLRLADIYILSRAASRENVRSRSQVQIPVISPPNPNVGNSPRCRAANHILGKGLNVRANLSTPRIVRQIQPYNLSAKNRCGGSR